MGFYIVNGFTVQIDPESIRALGEAMRPQLQVVPNQITCSGVIKSIVGLTSMLAIFVGANAINQKIDPYLKSPISECEAPKIEIPNGIPKKELVLLPLELVGEKCENDFGCHAQKCWKTCETTANYW